VKRRGRRRLPRPPLGPVTPPVIALVLAVVALAACSEGGRMEPRTATPSSTAAPTTGQDVTTTREPPMRPTQPVDMSVIPAPVSARSTGGGGFALDTSTRVVTRPGSPEVARIGRYLAGILRPSTGYRVPVVTERDEDDDDAIVLELTGDGGLGDEGYRLDVSPASVTLAAHRPAGLFRGVQTLRQLLPATIERSSVQRGPWRLPAVRVQDRPSFAWRGAALDVARHFFTVDEVKRYIDLISLYKLNMLHLHLTDDQGWRIAVDGWPRLATHGGSTQVGGGRGGYYTKRDYSSIVSYAEDRYVTVVPEVDMPGHVNAALASYRELNCDGRAPDLYTGIKVGFTSLCLDKPVTYRFLDDVIGELAALTPGPYLHVGGDEADIVPDDRYAEFMERVQRMVQAHGKRAVGWQEVASGTLLRSSVVQYWDTRSSPDAVRRAAEHGSKLVLSPASRVYLDMKYDARTELGLEWAGHVEVRDAYDWDPGTLLAGVDAADVLGVEAQLWSETLRSISDAELMALPRLPGVAEVGWSPASSRDWEDYRRRLAGQGPRWSAMGAEYYHSPQVPWSR
jgi:hexosaminidase